MAQGQKASKLASRVLAVVLRISCLDAKAGRTVFFHRQGHIRRGLNGEADIDLTLTRNAGTRIHLDCEQQKPSISKLRVAKQ